MTMAKTRRITTLTIEDVDGGDTETFRVDTSSTLVLPAIFHVFSAAVQSHPDEISAVQTAVKLLADVVVLYGDSPDKPVD